MKKLYKIERYKTKDEWLCARGIGGSSIASLFGKSKYKNALDIWCSAINPSEEPKKDKQTESTIYGHNAERPVCDIFALHHKDYKVKYPRQITLYRRLDKPFMTYTADALIEEIKTGRKGIYEGKTRIVQSKAEATEWRSGILPEMYVLQVLQGFAVKTDVEFVDLCVELIFIDYDTGLWKSSEIRSFHIERSECLNAIAVVEQVQTDFYENNIVKQIPPDLVIEVELGE